MTGAYWLNSAWMLMCRREAQAFDRATSDVAATQRAVLQKTLFANRDTEFGKEHGFGRIKSIRQFQEQVPVSTYDSYQERIERVAAGAMNVLTADKVELLEPTSGTTHGSKLIPYTRSLRRQFQRALAPWIWDLMQHRPAVRCGRAYWSISPAIGTRRRTPHGIPIGFDDDTAYLGLFERSAAQQLLAVPPAVSRVCGIENFRYLTLLHLVRAADLALISIWNPTFLTVLIGRMDEWLDRMASDLDRGIVSLPNPACDQTAIGSLRSRCNVRRAAQVRQIVRSSLSSAERLQALWPTLALISCWADGMAAMFVPQLRQLFPSVEIQPKGLLATEGCVSIPLLGRPGAALAVRSHFFEFAECTGSQSNETHASRLAWQLESGGQYQVILTTGGGLYRYQLQDVVEVVGFVNQCPIVKFRGRSGAVCDLVGEKLNEQHVSTVLRRVFAAHRMTPTFAMLAPAKSLPSRYLLFVQDRTLQQMPARTQSIEAAVEAGLQENPHYRYAIELEQLLPVQLRSLAPTEPAWSIYNDRCGSLGQKEGNIKPRALDSWMGWDDVWTSGLLQLNSREAGVEHSEPPAYQPNPNSWL